jgi:hypothetical protein
MESSLKAMRMRFLSVRSLAVLALQLPCLTCATNSMAQGAATDREWATVQSLIGEIHGISTTPPANLITPKYTSGALMGNGDIGVVAGDTSVDRQSFHFGKSDFWGGGAHYDGLPAVQTIKHNAPDCSWGCRVSILSLGIMTIASPIKNDDAAKVYRVDQDILHARVDTTLKLGGATVQLRSWTADGANTFVTEVTSSDAGATGLPIQLTLAMPSPDPAMPASFPVTVGSRGGVLTATRENDATGPQDYKARAAIAVSLLGAQFTHVRTGSNSATGDLTLKSGTPMWIVVDFESDARMGLGGPSSRSLAQHAINRITTTTVSQIERLQEEHLEWWKRFWMRSFVQVHDNVLEEYYYGALYVLGCASRPGRPAPSLFGNFITSDNVAWGALYFMNYNEEAPYYGVFSSNHSELAEPYIRMVMAQLPWQKNLTAAAGYKGVSYERTFSPITVIAKPPAPITVAAEKELTHLPSDQKSNATFSLLPAIQYYDYTEDRDFLRNSLYPAMKELDAFWRDYAVKDPSGQHWDIAHSAAHEGGDDLNPNLDIGFARRVDRELIATSSVLGVDADMGPLWKSFLDRLSPYPTGTVNGKTVYYIAASIQNKSENHGLFEPGDQPINLEGLVYPGENLSIGGDPRQLQIARDSMAEMNSWAANEGPNSENGFCKIFPIAARIGWPADDLVSKFRAAILHQWRPSNLTVFQAGGGIETSGSIEALDSMLLQHEDGILRVFPNWPSSMDASFTRLRAKGAFLVSSEQRDGAVIFIDVVSEHGGPLTIESPWAAHKIGVNAGQTALNPDARGKVKLETKPRAHYRLIAM